jgi:hypothetical protein
VETEPGYRRSGWLPGGIFPNVFTDVSLFRRTIEELAAQRTDDSARIAHR